MRQLAVIALLTQAACWSEQSFTDACLTAGHCVIDDAGSTGGGGGGTGGGGGVTGGGGGVTGGGGGSSTSDGGALTWGEVAGELFNVPMGLDPGFTIELVDAGVGGDWVGGVLAPSGDVICIPYAGQQALRISPLRSVSLIPLPMPGQWEGGVLQADGGVLGLPYEAPSFLSITDATTPFVINAGLPRPGASALPWFEGGVITLSERVFLSPSKNIFPAVFDLTTGGLILHDAGIPLAINVERFYAGAVLRADGESAILIPRNAQQLLLMTPDSATFVGPTNLKGHSGGLLMPDGGIMLIPSDDAEFVIWNGTSISVPNTLGVRDGYFSAAWSTNGYAYAMQTDGAASGLGIAIINRAGQVTEVPLAADAGLFVNSHYGLTSMADGTLVGCPYESDSVLFITPLTKRTVSLRTMTSPWLNKW